MEYRRTYKDDLSEGEYILQYAKDNLNHIVRSFPRYFRKRDIGKLQQLLEKKSLVEVRSRNTFKSVKELKNILQEKAITATHIIQISSGNHVARCVIDTQKVFQKELSKSLLTIRGVPALTCYGAGEIDDVRITETPETKSV